MNPEIFVHLFHILIVGSLFLYVGIKRDSISPYLYPILLGLGIIIIFYHNIIIIIIHTKQLALA